MPGPGNPQPDLFSIRAAAVQEESADTDPGRFSAAICPPSDGHPPAPDSASTLLEAGTTLHHCDQHDTPYGLGGVHLTPGPSRVRYLPQRHCRLQDHPRRATRPGWDAAYSNACQLKNTAPSSVPHTARVTGTRAPPAPAS
jgi:hypothetical protein